MEEVTYDDVRHYLWALQHFGIINRDEQTRAYYIVRNQVLCSRALRLWDQKYTRAHRQALRNQALRNQALRSHTLWDQEYTW